MVEALFYETLTIADVVAEHGITPETACRWCRKKWLPCSKKSRTWAIYMTPGELAAFKPPKSGPKAGRNNEN